MQAIAEDIFDPVALSLDENQFIIDHGGKPPAVVARVAMPPGVNSRAVMPVIEALYALDEVQKHDHIPWVGLMAVKARCQLYCDQHAEWTRMKARGGARFPTFPTMAGWDSRGNPSLGSTGSDSGHVRTYFDEHGDRQRLALQLRGGPESPIDLPRWVKQTVAYTELITNDTEGWIRCPVCQVTEKYQNDSQSSRNGAQSRMAKHLLSAKEHIEAHRDLHLKVFGR
jgi:hypothetical protein